MHNSKALSCFSGVIMSIRSFFLFSPLPPSFGGKARKLRSEGKGKRPHRAQSLNAEEEEILWDSLGLSHHCRILNKYCLLVVNSTFWVTGRQQHDMKMEDFCFTKDNNDIEFITF